MHIPSLIFFVYPYPKGSEENQFAPLGAGVNKLIFKRICILYVSLPIVIKNYILLHISIVINE
jgi:hypothetical protein